MELSGSPTPRYAAPSGPGGGGAHGSLSFAKDATYRVGHFATDPREPDARKLWFYRSGGGIEDPARWKKYYTDIRFMPLDTPEGGVICG